MFLTEFKTRLTQFENALRKHPEPFFRFAEDGTAGLLFEQHVYQAGRFTTPSIGELKARLQQRTQVVAAELRLQRLGGHKAERDIGHLQASAPAGTAFQVASQFNCLEAPAPHLVPIAQYFNDPTQGPSAAISAFPGAFLRRYQAPGAGGMHYQQTDCLGLNLLEDVLEGTGASVECGYLCTQHIPDPAALADALSERFECLRVGLHEDVQVVLGRHGAEPVTRDVRITQIFTSTIALGAFSRAHKDADFAPIRRALLKGAYLGTLLAALSIGAARIVLTQIGGGVFCNPGKDIWDAINWAVDAARPYAGAPLEILVNCYSDPDSAFAQALPRRALPL